MNKPAGRLLQSPIDTGGREIEWGENGREQRMMAGKTNPACPRAVNSLKGELSHYMRDEFGRECSANDNRYTLQ